MGAGGEWREVPFTFMSSGRPLRGPHWSKDLMEMSNPALGRCGVWVFQTGETASAKV